MSLDVHPALPIQLRPRGTKPHTSVVRLERQWYVACFAHELGRRPLRRVIAGTPVVVFRAADGAPATLLDRCAHRNVPLSGGKITGGHVQCPYHGWEFDAAGRCRAVPGLCRPLDPDRGRRVPAFAAREQDGLVWVYSTPDVEPEAPPFSVPRLEGGRYATVRRKVVANGTLHATLENALDVPHTAFLHGGLFRTGRRRNEIEAILRRSSRHAEVEYVGEPRPSGLVGRLLAPRGGVVTHFDRFFLPSIAQVDYRLGDDNHFLVTSACTPVSDFVTEMYAVIQFRLRVPAWLVKPVLEPVARRIFAQDARILGQQSDVIRTFGGEQFESTELDLMGPQIYRLLRQAERGALEPSDTPTREIKRVRFMA